jgi:uncharacterized membrane protein
VGFADTAAPDPNSANPVFCYVLDCFVTHAYEWRNGVKTDLGVLPGGASSAAFWINSNGLIAGNSQNGETDPVIPGLPEVRAVTWKNGHIRDLGTLGGSSSFSQAVNNRGQVTGLALNGIPDPFSFYYQFLYCLPFSICPPNATQIRAFVWDEEGGMQDIGTLGGAGCLPEPDQQPRSSRRVFVHRLQSATDYRFSHASSVPLGEGEGHEGSGQSWWHEHRISQRA